MAEVIYQPRAQLERARDQIPVLGEIIRRLSQRQVRDWRAPRPRPSALALGLVALGSGLFLIYRTRIE
jgi:hypothetical protein